MDFYLQLCHCTSVVFLLGNDEGEPEGTDNPKDSPLVSGVKIPELGVDVEDSPDPFQNDPGAGRREGVGGGPPERDRQEFADQFVIHCDRSKCVL